METWHKMRDDIDRGEERVKAKHHPPVEAIPTFVDLILEEFQRHCCNQYTSYAYNSCNLSYVAYACKCCVFISVMVLFIGRFPALIARHEL